MGTSYSLRHVAVLAAQLPSNARVRVAEDPDLAWDDQTKLIWQVEYDLRMIQWGMSSSKSRGNKPEPAETPSARLTRAQRIREAFEKRLRAREILGIEEMYGN